MIEINNLSFAYSKDKKVFENFSLNIEKGMLYGLLGANGAGKTSLISLISGIYRPLSGTLLINGLTYQKQKKQILTQLSIVPQEYAFYPRLTTLENLTFFSRLYCKSTRHITDVIELTGLEDYQNQHANALSGGLKRRLNLAIGLLNKPQLLILDEPTVGIDPQSRQMILDAIQHLNRQGMTIIYTSHYMEEIEKICSHVGILDKGVLLQQSNIGELVNNNSLSIAIEKPIDTHSWQDASLAFLTNNHITINNHMIVCNHITDITLVNLINIIKKEGLIIGQITYGKKNLEAFYFDLVKNAKKDVQ